MRERKQVVYDQTEQKMLGLPATTTAVEAAAILVSMQRRIIRFRGKAMISIQMPYEHFVPLRKEMFEQFASPLLIGMTKRQISDVFAYICGTADDLTTSAHCILFGTGTRRQTVWDMERLEARADISPDDCVWRSPYAVASIRNDEPVPLILSLAGGDTGLYSDIMQSIAPLIMASKPDGVIWWTGEDVSNKRVLVDALHKIFPNQLASLSVKQLIGGRSNTPLLNDVLGNLAEHDDHIADTEIYKSIGAHQDFYMHRHHSQNGIEIRGNVHHIFSALHAPTFHTKSRSVERRTHVIPLGEQSGSGRLPTLGSDTLGLLISEMCKYAVRLKYQGYTYERSGATTLITP